MPDPAIQQFFAERKEGWLKKAIKPATPADQISELEQQCADIFSLQQWLPNAAKRAGQINIASHPCTFSHPSARKNKNGYVTSIIADAERQADGYLRSGNVQVENDALGNAAALDVYKFLTLPMQDGQSLLQHIQQDSPLATELLTIETESYANLKDGFLAMTANSDEMVTSSKIKQVFFPVDGNYHQLSILSNSGLIYALRDRIDHLRFSEQQKEIRALKRTNEFSEQGFSEIYDITTIGYGGTKPQNISVLNNQKGGKARLLLSTPPQLAKRDINFPTRDFFENSIRYFNIKEPLEGLHKILNRNDDSPIPRRNLESGRDNRIEEILDAILLRMMGLRSVAAEQYRDTDSQLPTYQKIWLVAEQQVRNQQDDWLKELTERIAKWVVDAYKVVIKTPASLGNEEQRYILSVIESHREALR